MTMKQKFKQTETCGERSRAIGEIPEGWNEAVLGEVAEPVSQTHKFLGKDKIIFINTGDILAGKFLHRDYSKIDILPGQAKKMISQNDILFSEIRPVNKRYAFVDFPDTDDYVVSTKLIVIRAKKDILPEFLYRVLISNDALAEFQHIAESRSGTFPQITFDAIRDYYMLLPSLSEQRTVAKFLSDLDAKIELNHQMNKTLEAIAQAIFNRWFVDFEFPGHEKTRIINGLPDRWHQGTLEKIVTIESGKRPGEKSEIKALDFTVPLIGASSVMGYVKDALYKESILIIGRVGTHGIVQRVSWPSFPSDNTLVIRSKYFEFVYQILRTIDYGSLNVGTTQPLITQTAINKYGIIIPSDEILKQFETYVSGLFKKVVANNRENESLIEIRDSLLPRLMSGKIRVSDGR